MGWRDRKAAIGVVPQAPARAKASRPVPAAIGAMREATLRCSEFSLEEIGDLFRASMELRRVLTDELHRKAQAVHGVRA